MLEKNDAIECLPVRRTVSLRKMEANQRNALRSTGPKTPVGKNAVRWNAVKHGLLAKELLITAGDGKEDRGEFRRLFDQLTRDLDPQGALEEMLVEKIAVCYWRLGRVVRFETGAIRAGLDDAEHSYYRSLAQQTAYLHSLDPVLARDSSCGVQLLLRGLQRVRDEVQASGGVSEQARGDLAKFFGTSDSSLIQRCLLAAQCDPEESTASPPQKERVLAILDQEKQVLESRASQADAQDEVKLESHRARLNMPSKEATDQILRYEGSIERQLYRAMSQLERLQRRRLGEAVPPPVNIDVLSQR